MPMIAGQHAWKDAGYTPSAVWPDDTYVQWGSSGVVLGNPSYKTAFFEAFPAKHDDAGGFIRGEGKSIADAEIDALSKYQAQAACKHLWGRENYTNGGQLCRHCRAFRSGHIPPIVHLGAWRKPVEYFYTWVFESAQAEGRTMDRYERRLFLRSRVFGVTPRPAPSDAANG
jgi:hypothetical protein